MMESQALSHCLRLVAGPTCKSISLISSLLPPVAFAAGTVWHHFGTGPASFSSCYSSSTSTASPLKRWNCTPPSRHLEIRLFSSRISSNPFWHASTTFSCYGYRSLTLASSSPKLLLQPCSRPPPHSTSTPTRGHATCALAADGLLGTLPTTTNTPNTPSTSNAANMADKDLLPDTFKADHYDLKLTNLDFKDWSYNGSVTYEICPSLATS